MSLFLPIGARLKEERDRIGLSQTEFAELAGVTRKTLYGYEAGERAPDAACLNIWAGRGLDVLYVITGQRQGHGIGESAVHQAVLDAVELLSLEKKVDADQLARAVTKLAVRSPTPSNGPHQGIGKQVNITASGPRAQAAGRKIVNKRDA
ncbi:helix-turn-helix transcriptional regulator [Azonexus sp.]|jgi:transcriptional regulator with XRE-family HTH domain|uniref:helix-turn-helix domain-containing protein n=1 Tax=Azonexus sp. TaxID=1872668 RepID=UPI002829267A|nr:helix-turn-helix transcriptional regulator [Azonexus sp.]MDR1995136.1 helix-turn-helix domain-containing protein [Azonexus sp.]